MVGTLDHFPLTWLIDKDHATVRAHARNDAQITPLFRQEHWLTRLRFDVRQRQNTVYLCFACMACETPVFTEALPQFFEQIRVGIVPRGQRRSPPDVGIHEAHGIHNNAIR